MSQLNSAQMQAISHHLGPCLILAGPGSGKTTVIIRRIEYLIRQFKVDPNEILVITFTKAAALQMQERFMEFMNQEFLPVTFGTFHAIFFHILQNAFYYTQENIIRESEKKQYLREICQQLLLDNVIDEEFLILLWEK